MRKYERKTILLASYLHDLILFLLKKNLVRKCVIYVPSVTGWVVTWFLLGYTVRMFEYAVRTF